MKFFTAILFAFFCHTSLAGTGDVLRTVASLNGAISNVTAGLRYDVTAKIVLPLMPQRLAFYAADSTGTTEFGMDPKIMKGSPTNVGDIVHIRGIVVHTGNKDNVGLHSEQITLVSHGEPPKPIPASAKDIYESNKLKNAFITINGVIYDAFRDEIDHLWSFLVLNCDGTPIYVAVFSGDASSHELDKIIGANVSVDGVVSDYHSGNRIILERYITTHGISSIKVLSPSPDPFTVPEYSSPPFTQSANHMGFGRRRIAGHVIAVWNCGKRILVRTDSGSLVRADLKSTTPPRYGEHIEISGIPTTDLYRRNLARAVWRQASDLPFYEEPSAPVTAKSLFTDQKGHAIKNADLYGKAVTVRGIVRAIPPNCAESGRLYLECDSFMVPVDTSACPKALDGITAGCTLAASGTYILETDNLRSSNVFPQIKEILIVVRKPEDIMLLANPPWWTPGRTIVLIAALISIILGICWWNIALRRRAELRGKELAAEQVAHVTSELKVYERTRLAVELHDSLSQTLTGVSMGIDSLLDLAQDMPEHLKRQLDYTSKTVEACRTELKNCLWDLRSEALEAADMNDAIKIALGQIVNHTALTVRFNVPREQLSDKTAHTILRIIRELVTNAIRHGHATEIKIAGSIDGETLRFSVRDNGGGFDFDQAPGIAEGHFGLQGIQERLDLMDGDMTVESAPSKDTKVTITIRIPAEKTTGGATNG